MQLHVARLCLDCNEVHDADRCPACTSEAFAYLTRWVPAPERRQRPRPTSSPAAEVYRDLLTEPQNRRPSRKLLNTSVLGVGALAVAGWLWQRNAKEGKPQPSSQERQETPDAGQ